MGRMFQSVLGDLPWQLDAAGWSPTTDVTETDDAFVVEADLPGVKKDQVNVELSGRELTISGEIQESDHKGVARRSARRSGRFEFRTLLPGEVDADRVSAQLSDGVLTVTVPKAMSAKPKRVEISGG
jgi:HSP20 family protein